MKRIFSTMRIRISDLRALIREALETLTGRTRPLVWAAVERSTSSAGYAGPVMPRHYAALRRMLGRDPTPAEVLYFRQEWSKATGLRPVDIDPNGILPN